MDRGKYSVCHSNIILVTFRDHNYGIEVSGGITAEMYQRDVKIGISEEHAIGLTNEPRSLLKDYFNRHVFVCVDVCESACGGVCRGWTRSCRGVFSLMRNSKWAAADDAATSHHSGSLAIAENVQQRPRPWPVWENCHQYNTWIKAGQEITWRKTASFCSWRFCCRIN